MELGRALRRGAAAADTSNARFPISGFVVELAESRTAFRNGCPGFLRAGDMCDETSLRKGYLTGLPRLAFRHAETARQLRRRARVVHRLCTHLGGSNPERGLQGEKEHERQHSRAHHHNHRAHGNTVSRLAATRGSA